MKRAVIFDLDGTLSDSIQSIKYSGDLALEPFGYGPFDVEQYKYFVGDGAANLIRRALLKSGDHELVHFEEAFALYQEYFAADCMYQVKPYDGIPELLTALKERGLKDILKSPCKYIESSEFFSWERFFTHLLEKLTEETPVTTRYNKQGRLPPFFRRRGNIDKVLGQIPSIKFKDNSV